MTKLLENQRHFLGSTGQTHVQTIDEQTSLLNAHRQRMSESHNTQSQLCNEVVQTIMSGVQSLVSSEMEKMAKTQMNHFQVLDRDGISLASTNEKITQSAKQVVENMRSTNRIVSEKSSIVCNNDLKFGEAVKLTGNTLVEMMSSSSAHRELTTDFASKSCQALSEMNQLEEHTLSVVSRAEQDGKSASASLLNSVLNPTSNEMKKMLQSSVEAMSHVTDEVVPNTNMELEAVAENRKLIATQMRTTLESASSELLNTTKRVSSLVKSQHDVAERLGNETLAASNTHEKESVPYYYAELDSGKERLLSTITNLAESSTRAASEGIHQGSSMKQSVEDFAQNKMQCTKPMDPEPPRKECAFGRSLSSTPGEDEILTANATSCKDAIAISALAAHGAESPIQPDADTSQESHDTSQESHDIKRKRSGSISHLPSPRLKSRDINVDHSDSEAGSKPRKHHRYAKSTSSVGRKSKCPSGRSPSKHTWKRRKW